MRKLRDPNGENRQDVWPQTLLAMETGTKYYYLTTLGVVRTANTLLGGRGDEGGPYPNTQKVLVTGRYQTGRYHKYLDGLYPGGDGVDWLAYDPYATNHFQWTLV